MLISKNWLQTYFDKKLPEAERIAEVLNLHAFEVEDIKAWDKDEILDVKILADKACYALCHRGIAGEIGAIGNLRLATNNKQPAKESIKTKPDIEIKKPGLCARYIGRMVENVKIDKSPDWLRARLESIGERSINNIVDAANFVMFDIGQPLHAFDADRVKGAIQVRLAKKGETIITLDNREVALDSSILIIADSEGPLAIAGVKGGKRAEVSDDTKNLILEAANFDRSSIRLTSTRLDLKTGAAKRFEANLSPELAGEAMETFSALIQNLSPDAKFGPVNDVYKRKYKSPEIVFPLEFVGDVLGIKITPEEIISTLARLGITATKKGKNLLVAPPLSRTDLNIPEDIIEEVGRIYGYENVVGKLPPVPRGHAIPHKTFFYTEKAKNVLIEQGFNEVFLSSFASKGYFELACPLAEDKKYLRENLSNGIAESLRRNAQNAPLLGLSEIRLFEIGAVFGPHGERIHICVGRRGLLKKDRRNEEILREVITLLGAVFETPLPAKISSDSESAIAELDVTEIFSRMRLPGSYESLDLYEMTDKKFLEFSQFPFALRDIAVFTPKGTSEREVVEIVKKEAGEWLQRADLFDVFEKKMEDGSEKISYAFHLVFQAMTKTLTDGEVNEVMDKITKKMNVKAGWQVR